jgi:hypothetical protein
MQKKHLFIPFIALTFTLASLSYHLSPTFAASPSPSVKPSPSVSPSPSSSPVSEAEATENLKKRLQESLDLESTPTSPSKARAYVGIVKDVIKDTIIMEDKDGKKDIKLQEDTTIVRSPAGTAIKPENIRIDDYIIAIGYPGETDILLGKRLIVSAEEIKPPAKVSALGVVTKIGKNSLTIKLEDKDQLVSTTTKTIFKSAVGTIEFSDVEVGDTLIYTANIDDDDDLTATVIMRVQTAAIAE